MNEPDYKKPILDIEDLCNSGRVFNCCPYYASMELRKEAEIIFLPYNYLLDPKIRDICKIDLKNAIVILDEAHNVDKACEQNACTSITTTNLFAANTELNQVIPFFLSWRHKRFNCLMIFVSPMQILEMLDEFESDEDSDEMLEFNSDNVTGLQTQLKNLERILSTSADYATHNGGHLFELFRGAEVYISIEICVSI